MALKDSQLPKQCKNLAECAKLSMLFPYYEPTLKEAWVKRAQICETTDWFKREDRLTKYDFEEEGLNEPESLDS